MQKYLEAGKVVTTHGVRGEMKLELWCDGVAFLKKGGPPVHHPPGRQVLQDHLHPPPGADGPAPAGRGQRYGCRP